MSPQTHPGKTVQYELMRGREATDAIRAFPVGYLPVGCLERHGDHLPMGLDVIKAHKVCCAAARAIGGVVFPPHYYAGIHRMSDTEIAKYTGEWGNIYTDQTAWDSLEDVVHQLAIAGIRALVLYSGHYPQCQTAMITEIATAVNGRSALTVIPFCERMILPGDHAGINETSLMLHLDPSLVDMTRIGEVNYRDHGWRDDTSPEKANREIGEQQLEAIIAHLGERIRQVPGYPFGG